VDERGNCIKVDSHPRAKHLHYAWDDTIVWGLERSMDSGRPETTARRLEQTYAAEKALDVWIPGHTKDIAWESNQIARSDVYNALRIPVEPCDPPAALCRNEPEVALSSAYLDRADMVAGHQLAKAGFRLASLLNEIWTVSVGPNDVAAAANSSPSQVVSSKTASGEIVGNRRSKIYAWYGCGTYDRWRPRTGLRSLAAKLRYRRDKGRRGIVLESAIRRNRCFRIVKFYRVSGHIRKHRASLSGRLFPFREQTPHSKQSDILCLSAQGFF
jgi:hypothetical protein